MDFVHPEYDFYQAPRLLSSQLFLPEGRRLPPVSAPEIGFWELGRFVSTGKLAAGIDLQLYQIHKAKGGNQGHQLHGVYKWRGCFALFNSEY